MNAIIRKSQKAIMKSFDNLFIEMSAKYCNQKCKHCYIDFPQFKKIEDFISIEIIEKALNDLRSTDLKCIYLSGAEPMTHPDFNAILRLCLKKTNVCICTNGSFINEKKARFLKKVEDESDNEIIFKISLDHYDEMKNDNIRYRGAYRQAVFAIKHLLKYDFTSIITVTNYYQESEDKLINGILEIFSDYDISKSYIDIRPWYDKNKKTDKITEQWSALDCEYGRVLTSKGVYTCSFLANDYRGRSGSTFEDYSKTVPLETNFCATCTKCSHQMFGVNFDILN